MSTDRKKSLDVDSVTVSAVQLFELLPEHPVVSMLKVTQWLGTTKPTATKAIAVLQQANILREVGNKKRIRIYAMKPVRYCCRDVLEILNLPLLISMETD